MHSKHIKIPVYDKVHGYFFCKGSEHITISSSEKDRRIIFHITGEIDHHSARDIMLRIDRDTDAALPRDCILDMSGVSFMDSSGIAVILKSYRRMQLLGGRLWIENVQAQPMKVLDASGIERLVPITARPQKGVGT